MSELDPEIKKDLVQKIEKIGNDNNNNESVYNGQKSKDKIDPTIFIATFSLILLVGVFLYKNFTKKTNLTQNNSFQEEYQNNNNNPPIYKNNPQQYEYNNPPIYRNPQQQYPPTYRNPQQYDKLQEVEKRLDKLDQRTWLLSIANNENVVISRQIVNKILNQPNLAEKYVTFDRNWKLSKSPEFLNLTSADRLSLLNHVNNYYPSGQTYNQPGQTYNQPGQTYNQPGQTYNQPGQTYNQPRQTYNQPGQTYNQPGQTYNQPRVFNWNSCY